MRRLLLISILPLWTTLTHAQFTPELSLIFGGNSLDDAVDIATNQDSSALFLGLRSFSTDGDVPGNNGGTDFWIMKRHINGILIWNKNFGGFNNDDISTVMPLPDGGVLGFGTTRNDQGDYGNLTGLAGGWLMRTNSNGEIVSGRIYGGEISETGIDAYRSPNGDITMAFESASPEVDGQQNHGFLDVWILRVDNTYNLKWSILLGGTRQESPAAITTDINGNTYVAATSHSDLPGTAPNNGEADVWIFKLDPTGNMVWQKNFGGTGDDIASDIVIGNDGRVYVTAYSNSSDGDFYLNYGEEDIWILSLDATNGDLGIINHYGGSGNEVNPVISTMGNTLVVAATTDSDSVDLTGNKNFNDVWVFTINHSGVITQQMNYGGSLSDQSRDIIVIDSVIYLLNTSTSNDKNVPANQIAQQDIWYLTLDANPESCSDEFLCQSDTTLSNILAPPANDQLICVGACTAGLEPGPSFIGGSCGNFTEATAYFKLLTDTTADLVTLSATSDEFNQPRLALLRTGDCNTFTPVACAIGENGYVLLQYIAVEPLTTYIIAISDAEGNVGDFELCATSIDVEFCNEKDTLYVTKTSMGSPLSGPFKPGELVSFCYELTTWNKLDCNGFQGLVPTFGPAWDESGFNIFGEPVMMDTLLTPEVPIGFWAWYELGEVRYNVANPIRGFDGNQGLPPGWYFTNTTDVPPNNDPDETTGDIFTCLPSPDKWKVCFTLPVEDECLGNLDASITMRTFADGEIGVNTSLACSYDQVETLSLGMVCCLNPTVQPIQDFFVCSGDTVILLPETNIFPPFTYSWTADPDVGIEGATAGIDRTQFYQVLRNETSSILKVNYVLWAEGDFCEADPIIFSVSVRPSPSTAISTTGATTVCEGNSVTFNFESVGTPPFVIELLRDNVFFADLLSEQLTLTLPIDPLASGRFRIGEMRDAFCSGEGTGFVNITVKPSAVNNIDSTICEGGSVVIGTQTFDVPGTYTVVFEDAADNNCDSIVNLNLTIVESNHEFITEQICGQDTVFVLGVPYTETTNEIIEYTGPLGCPDYIHLNLTRRDTITDQFNQRICYGDTLDFEGIAVYQDGIYTHVEELVNGCYSQIILNLDVLNELKVNEQEIIADIGGSSGAILLEFTGGDPPYTYLWNNGNTGESLFNVQHGTYSITVTDEMGCSASFTFVVPFGTAIHDPGLGDAIKMYPTLTSAGEEITIEILDPVSKKVQKISWLASNGTHLDQKSWQQIESDGSIRLTVPNSLAPGVYFLRIKTEAGASAWKKVILQ